MAGGHSCEGMRNLCGQACPQLINNLKWRDKNMKITKNAQGNTTTLVLQGRLDTVTSTQLANEISAVFAGEAVNLVFDFIALESAVQGCVCF